MTWAGQTRGHDGYVEGVGCRGIGRVRQSRRKCVVGEGFQLQGMMLTGITYDIVVLGDTEGSALVLNDTDIIWHF